MIMLPVVKSEHAVAADYQSFLNALAASGFSGDIETKYSHRLAVATDNSIYQQLPQAVLLPKHVDDLVAIGNLLAEHTSVKVSARGGGTGTNGQSLTPGVVIDLSRHMNAILEINAEESWVRVQAGVVKDQLNDALRPLGFFFAPDLSTSNRATIGGMINTDASGQGSLVYGKTSDHILGLTAVLANGEVLSTEPSFIAEHNNGLDDASSTTVENSSANTRRVNYVAQQVIKSCVDNRDAILAKFPRLNRFLTGYDLEHAVSDDLTQFDLGRVIAGSEGSLAFVAEAKLNITPIAKAKALINIKYDSFESALRHAPAMVAAKATSVETVDSNVLNLAKQDIIWHSVSELITDVPDKVVLGLNMVEYNGEDPDELKQQIELLTSKLDADIAQQKSGVIGYQVTYSLADIGKIYAMRKKAVGLLGKTPGSKKPVAFAEDTAVPPENLADFIMEFRALLDSKGLHYGMFGHVDAGVLHVRPALDMCDPEQEILLQSISDEVVALVAKYGGLMWGEHGKGYRSEYGPAFFGDELFNELRKIKTAFDPHNQMNPGKICTPIDSDEELVKVSSTKRGFYDRQIPIAVRESWQPAMNCNGNGLCFNYDTRSPMCPSFKVKGDRRHSPKGRAGMIREWLRLNAANELTSPTDAKSYSWWQKQNPQKDNLDDFSHEVFEVMDDCLACKACSNQCPVNVSVPDFRARFIETYYQRYARPAKDYLVANIERLAPVMAKFAGVVNWGMSLGAVQKVVKSQLGYIDAPLLSQPALNTRVAGIASIDWSKDKLASLSDTDKARTVLIVQDPFTSFYEANLIDELVQLAVALGLNPVLLPFSPNGKPQHVKGFLTEFSATAQNTANMLNEYAALNIPLIGVDPSMVLCFRDEYTKALGEARGDFHVLLVHEWLQQIIANGLLDQKVNIDKKLTELTEFALLGHCTEKTMLPNTANDWRDIFAHFGLQLRSVAVGCCGMAGTFGHESHHFDDSKGIYELSWQTAIDQLAPEQVLATGYSCRSQVGRFEKYKPKHPLQALLKVVMQNH